MLFSGMSLALALLGADAPPSSNEALTPAPAPYRAQVDDPLLAPPPAPTLLLATWDDALRRLRQSSTDQAAAVAAVERAEGRFRQALGVILPNLRGQVSALYDALNPNVPPLAVAVGARGGERGTVPLGVLNVNGTLSVVDVGAWKGVSSASAAHRSAEASLRDVERRLVRGLSGALVAVVAAERVAELNRLGLTQALERAALTARTQELGAATRLDVTRVRQDVEVARGTLIAGDEQLMRTREALGVLLGIDGGVGVTMGFALDAMTRELEAGCSKTPWQRRDDLLAAQESLDSATKSRQQALAGYLPSLGLTTGVIGYTTEVGFGRFASWNIAAVLSFPLWEGGTREGLVAERRGIETQASASLESSRRQVAVEVLQARRSVAVAEALAQSAESSRRLAAELDTLTRRAFEVGRGSSLELVQSAQALRQADNLLATRQYELVQARLDAYLTEAQCAWSS